MRGKDPQLFSSQERISRSRSNMSNVATLRLRKQISELQEARGSGTSLISLFLSGGSQVSEYNKLLTQELGTAKCIKSRVVRLAVMEAIRSLQHRLRLLGHKAPPKGLALFCGLIESASKQPRKVLHVVEPLRELRQWRYLCDSTFHVSLLEEQLEDGATYGFVIVDGNGTTCGLLKGARRQTLCSVSVHLPKKHNKGGQSAGRFFRKCV